MNKERLREMARRGLEFERNSLRIKLQSVEADLRELGGVKATKANGPVAHKTTGRKNWTQEQRDAVAKRMKAYWDAKRAAKATKPRGKVRTG